MDDSDRCEALRLVPVSRETAARLTIYAELLQRWQRVTNLVAPTTLPQVWTRHFADSAQLLEVVPTAKRWIDLGSGAGFPGLVLAMQLAEIPDAHVHLVESDSRKCAFLRAVIRETGACASVVPERIERAMSHLPRDVDAVAARALAPLVKLVEYTNLLLTAGVIGVFLKGRSVRNELTTAANLLSFQVDLVPSRTDPQGRIVLVRRPHTKDD